MVCFLVVVNSGLRLVASLFKGGDLSFFCYFKMFSFFTQDFFYVVLFL